MVRRLPKSHDRTFSPGVPVLRQIHAKTSPEESRDAGEIYTLCYTTHHDRSFRREHSKYQSLPMNSVLVEHLFKILLAHSSSIAVGHIFKTPRQRFRPGGAHCTLARSSVWDLFPIVWKRHTRFELF